MAAETVRGKMLGGWREGGEAGWAGLGVRVGEVRAKAEGTNRHFSVFPPPSSSPPKSRLECFR